MQSLIHVKCSSQMTIKTTTNYYSHSTRQYASIAVHCGNKYARPKMNVSLLDDQELNTESTLAFRNLACSKGGRTLFQGVDCTVHSGKWLHIVGANGVGKTSLLRMLCGLAPVEAGEILWRGAPIGKIPEVFRRDLCYLGHLNALQESMTIQENLAFSCALGGFMSEVAHVNELLHRFGVGGRGQQLVRHLSQGQKRRVALSRLALSRAPLWVLDEPFVAMDHAGIHLLADLIAQHLSTGGIAVLTSHQDVDIGSVPAQILELMA